MELPKIRIRKTPINRNRDKWRLGRHEQITTLLKSYDEVIEKKANEGKDTGQLSNILLGVKDTIAQVGQRNADTADQVLKSHGKLVNGSMQISLKTILQLLTKWGICEAQLFSDRKVLLRSNVMMLYNNISNMQPMINEYQFKILLEECAEQYFDSQYDQIYNTKYKNLDIAEKIQHLCQAMLNTPPEETPQRRSKSWFRDKNKTRLDRLIGVDAAPMTLSALNLTTTAGSQIEQELADLIVDSKEEDEILDREFQGIGYGKKARMLPEVSEHEEDEADFEITRLEKINDKRQRRAVMRDLRTAMDQQIIINMSSSSSSSSSSDEETRHRRRHAQVAKRMAKAQAKADRAPKEMEIPPIMKLKQEEIDATHIEILEEVTNPELLGWANDLLNGTRRFKNPAFLGELLASGDIDYVLSNLVKIYQDVAIARLNVRKVKLRNKKESRLKRLQTKS